MCLDLWPAVRTPRAKAFTTVSGWASASFLKVTDHEGTRLVDNTKRAAFLRFWELPRHLTRPLELALCLSDHAAAPAPWEMTARHVYVRGHGPTGEYRDNYAPKTLRKWAEAIKKENEELRNLLDLVASRRGNVVTVDHHREGTTTSALQTEVEIVVSTRDEGHCQELLAALSESGHSVERLGPPV